VAHGCTARQPPAALPQRTAERSSAVGVDGTLERRDELDRASLHDSWLGRAIKEHIVEIVQPDQRLNGTDDTKRQPLKFAFGAHPVPHTEGLWLSHRTASHDTFLRHRTDAPLKEGPAPSLFPYKEHHEAKKYTNVPPETGAPGRTMDEALRGHVDPHLRKSERVRLFTSLIHDMIV
jgi:hypothetical protein